MVPPTLYFFVILHIVSLIRALMTKGEGLPPASTASIAVAALVLGKSVLLANVLPYINRFPERPLIWNVCWKIAGLLPGRPDHSLPRAPVRLLEGSAGLRRRERKAARRDRLAALRGDPDPPRRADHQLLHRNRACARDRREGADDDVLRPAAGTSEADLIAGKPIRSTIPRRLPDASGQSADRACRRGNDHHGVARIPAAAERSRREDRSVPDAAREAGRNAPREVVRGLRRFATPCARPRRAPVDGIALCLAFVNLGRARMP